MSILTPDTGLLFWMVISFGIVVFVLSKYGFPVILKRIEERKAAVEESLHMAFAARIQLEKAKYDGEVLVENARKEQLRILKEASVQKELLVEEAKSVASKEADKIIRDARNQMMREKEQVFRDVHRMVSELSLQVAEKVIREQLDKSDEQMLLIHRLIHEANISKS